MKYVIGETGARKLRELLTRGSAGSIRRGVVDMAFGDDLPPPFAVQWAQSVNGGDGAWIIWLPTDSCLVVNGKSVDLREDLDDADGDYPEGWYVLDDVIEDEDTLYLNVSLGEIDEETGALSGEPSAEFSNERKYGGDESSASSSSAGTEPSGIDIPICDVITDSSSGARTVRQYVMSIIILGSGTPTRIAGDAEGSEWVTVNGVDVSIQPYPGEVPDDEDEDNCGLTFTTVSPRVEDGKVIPAKIIVGVKDKSDRESWAAHEMIVPTSGGGTKVVHFLGCDDVDLSNIGGGGDDSSASSSSSSGDPDVGLAGCWRLSGGFLVDCYYNVGGVTKKADSIDVSALLGVSGALLCAEFSGGGVVARRFASLAALNSAQADESRYIVPLYILDATGGAAVDLRMAPQIQVFEGTL